jgi:hypothetical protein
MLSEDPLELLQSRIKSLGVRSKSSQERHKQHQASPSCFYGKLDEDDQDSTFEPDSTSSSTATDLSTSDEVDLCIPEQEIEFLKQEANDIDDGGKLLFYRKHQITIHQRMNSTKAKNDI